MYQGYVEGIYTGATEIKFLLKFQVLISNKKIRMTSTYQIRFMSIICVGDSLTSGFNKTFVYFKALPMKKKSYSIETDQSIYKSHLF